MLFFLLCVGMLWLGRGMTTHADLLQLVRGKVPAPPLTEPAVITSPQDNAQFGATPIDVDGSCPDQSYINLERDGVFAGTALCQPDGTFHLQVGLVPGVNSLQAHVFNITDDEGPLSPAVSVSYVPPTPPSPPATGPAAGTPQTAKPFIISSSYRFYGYRVGQDIDWSVVVGGGANPYNLSADWGDGSQSNYVSKTAGNLTIDHQYEKAGSYVIALSATDNQGDKAFLQLVAIVTDGKSPAISVFTSPGSAIQPPVVSSSFFQSWTAVAAYSYGLVCLMVVSYWLGEQHEYLVLVRARGGNSAPKRRK